MPEFIIGTRGSLLAVAQSTLVKNQLEKISGAQFTLKTMKTQGDQITNVPLWQLDGKDFFTKELDQALLQQEVDLVIHSYKDLGSDRPAGIELGAITKRFFPHDILLVKKEKKQFLKQKKTWVVGTSSPRRIEQLTQNLPSFLPAPDTQIETKLLRGNVNTRLEKLLNDEYDAIVLALAGLERLAHGPESKEQLLKLLAPLDFMVLPLQYFPPSAAQGALAIEINSTSAKAHELKKILSSLHHDQTAREVSREKQSFQFYGGGCHLAVGISCQEFDGKIWERHYGMHDERLVEKTLWDGQEYGEKFETLFVGLPPHKLKNKNILVDRWLKKIPVEHISLSSTPAHYYVTSTYGLENFSHQEFSGALWAPAAKTMKGLAKAGLWCHGCADGLGASFLQNFQDSLALTAMLGAVEKRYVLTHKNAALPGYELKEIYTHQFSSLTQEDKAALLACQAFYWTSYSQFSYFIQEIPQLDEARYQHFCGLGRTLENFQKHGRRVKPIPSLSYLIGHP